MNRRHPLLQQAVKDGHLRELDRYLAEELGALHGCDETLLLVSAALVSRANGDGHTCLELGVHAGTTVWRDAEAGVAGYTLPELPHWRTQLLASPLVCTAEAAATAPLRLDAADRLYLARYYDFEQRIATALRTRLCLAPLTDTAAMAATLARHFPTQGAVDMQQVAAAIALLRPLAILSGGPGTGKTRTVSRLLAGYLELWPDATRAPRIALAAPTGKAAARLTESITKEREQLTGMSSAAVVAAIPNAAATLHRLLGYRPGRVGFRHHRDNPLHLDLLIVDEASMLDVPMMARLLDALPPSCRLVLLGDRDQLASVEAGSVFSDLCHRGAPITYTPPFQQQLRALGLPPLHNTDRIEGDGDMADSLAILSHSYRFGSDSGIGALARAVNRGEAEAARRAATDHGEVELTAVTTDDLAAALGRSTEAHYRPYLEAGDPETALTRYGQFRVLCAVREGDYGVAGVNAAIERGLQSARLIDTGERYYHGRPVMVTRNDYQLNLYNGDVGLCLRDPEADGRIRVFFRDSTGQLRRVLPSRLPEHETAYALTVHKSQGSEFDRCLVLLPDYDSPVLTRELLYTAVTRARQAVQVWCGDPTLLDPMVARHVARHSGLHAALWE